MRWGNRGGVRLGLAAAALLLLPSASARAQDLVVETFLSYVEALQIQGSIPGLAGAVVSSSGPLWEGGFGWADVEATVPVGIDTPFHVDGLTQLMTAALVLRCVDEGRLDLAEPIGPYDPVAPDGAATLGEILSHTAPGSDGPVFDYRPDRWPSLAGALHSCTTVSLPESVGMWLERLAMDDSMPGSDAAARFDPTTYAGRVARYEGILTRLAVPYRVDGGRSISEYTRTSLDATSGLIASVRDLARFDLALRSGQLLRPATLEEAWRIPVDRDGALLPHGLGWWAQIYRGELVVWQFGHGPDASSSLMVTVPGRELTLILLANSDGLAAPFEIEQGDVTASPFGRLFLEMFVL